MKIPFFQTDINKPASDRRPLGFINGLLLLDSGEVEHSFIFRCQERYLTYNSLAGLQSLFFVINRDHLQKYKEEITRSSAFLAEIKNVSQIPFGELPPPLFVPCNAEELLVENQDWFADEILPDEIKFLIEGNELFLNQISPSTLKLVSQTETVLRRNGFDVDFHLENLKIAGELALQFHNKAEYVRLIRESSYELPAHVPTALLEPVDFLTLKSWEELVNLYTAQTGDEEPESFFIKSSFDSAGNVAIRLTADNFDEKKKSFNHEIKCNITFDEIDERKQIDDLRADINISPSLSVIDFSDSRLAAYKKMQRDARTGIKLLVQREILSNPDANFDSFGILCFIKDGQNYEFIQSAAQLYADPHKHHFIGSYIHDAFNEDFRHDSMLRKLQNLCRSFAEKGYRGPLGFDCRLNENGEYIFIYDANPRLTAVYPPLAVRSFFHEKGFSAESVMSLGYRGEFIFDDLTGTLSHFTKNNLLFTPKSGKGLVLLPNLCRLNGFDITLVNLTKNEIADLVTSGILLETANSNSPVFRKFY
jgi:hypothetical protein